MHSHGKVPTRTSVRAAGKTDGTYQDKTRTREEVRYRCNGWDIRCPAPWSQKTPQKGSIGRPQGADRGNHRQVRKDITQASQIRYLCEEEAGSYASASPLGRLITRQNCPFRRSLWPYGTQLPD